MELYHHGIIGQKRGVRRFQNADGSLTNAGRKRYNADILGQIERVRNARDNVKSAKRKLTQEQWKNTFKNGGIASKETTDSYKNAVANLSWEKRKLSDEITKEALNRSSGKKSKHRLALEQKYMEKRNVCGGGGGRGVQAHTH